ncbi:MAG: carboxylating nicotinate-nucleotide diphosphorylase [bacterium]
MAPVPFPASPLIHDLLAAELATDIPHGDLSTMAFPAWCFQQSTASLVTRQAGVLAGFHVFELVWQLLGGKVTTERRAASGDWLTAGQEIARFTGPAATLLAGERTAINLVSHLSGIATLTGHCVAACAGTATRICDTRKTLPGLRTLQKYAVRVGGGVNHRYSLSDAVMLKDNHLTLITDLSAAVAELRRSLGPTVRIEVEVGTPAEFVTSIKAGVDAVLLDNMENEAIAWCVERRSPGLVLEASGGITLERIPAVAALGVDYISIGGLTHSAPALDLSLEFQPTAGPVQ